MTTTTTNLSEALKLAALGWLVFPVHSIRDGNCTCNKTDCGSPGKHPWTRNGFKDGTTDENKIRLWWEAIPRANIGIVTGKESGVIVLDVDAKNGGLEKLDHLEEQYGKLPETLVSQTGGDGLHYFFKYPDGGLKCSAGKLEAGIDIRADGGYVVGPPSNHISGGEYVWQDDEPGEIEIADLPQWIIDELKNPTENIARNENSYSEGNGSIPEGIRNTTLASIAGTMRRRGLGQEDIESALLAHNKEKCQPPLSDDEVRRIAASIGQYPPGKVTDAVGSEPQPLFRSLPEPDPFPVEALGTILADAVNYLAEYTQAPIAICGQSILAAVALAAQGHADFEIDGRSNPISEFFLTIGESGERKSAVDKLVLTSHRIHQDNLRKTYDDEIKVHLKAQAAYKKTMDETLSKNKGDYHAKMKALESIGDPPEPPLKPFYIIEEPTYEGFVKLLADGQPAQGIFSDEGGRFMGGHGMNQDNILKTAAGLSNLWDGKPISRVRAGDGASLLAGRRVSLHLMAQPNVAQMMLSNPLLLHQGLVSRCLVTYPKSTVGTRFYKEMNISGSVEMERFHNHIMEILNAPLPLIQGKANELDPPLIKLSSDAKGLWISFHDTVEKKLSEGGELHPIKALGNKAPEHANRLAANLTLFNDLQAKEIPLEFMAGAIKLVRFYLNEGLRLQEAGAVDSDLALAKKALDWLQDQKKSIITLVELYTYGPNPIRTARTSRNVMVTLVEHGWATPLKEGAEFDGKTRKEAWEVRILCLPDSNSI